MKKPTKGEIQAFKAAAKKDAGDDNTLSKKEFNHLANQVCEYVKSKK